MTKDELLAVWTDGMPKINLADLEQIAQRNGQPFPAPYVELVSRYGLPYFDDGKVFDVDWRKADGTPLSAEEIEDIDPVSGVSTFSDIATIRDMTDLVHTFAARGQPMIPKGMFPFSMNSAGNYLLFKGDDPQRGSVWLWSRKDEIWGEGDNVWIGFVANDFDDFLFNRLRDPGPGD